MIEGLRLTKALGYVSNGVMWVPVIGTTYPDGSEGPSLMVQGLAMQNGDANELVDTFRAEIVAEIGLPPEPLDLSGFVGDEDELRMADHHWDAVRSEWGRALAYLIRNPLATKDKAALRALAMLPVRDFRTRSEWCGLCLLGRTAARVAGFGETAASDAFLTTVETIFSE